MARKRKHEEHANHEAWAIPYGDLVTLLLAFFVVMYAISSVNEGKFRVLSDSLVAAFRGPPKSLQPVQVGEKSRGSGADISMSIVQQAMIEGQPRELLEVLRLEGQKPKGAGTGASGLDGGNAGGAQSLPGNHPMAQQLKRVADELESALQSLVAADLVAVRRHEFWLEVEVRTDILFPSGVATLADKAIPALDALADTLVKHPNPVRVEGHTDNRPINTKYYPSNWELSAARAASVVHRFQRAGISSDRLSVIGFGEFRPVKPNDSVAGRIANRRVVIVILAGAGAPAPTDAADMAAAAINGNAPVALPPQAATETLDAPTSGEAAPPRANSVTTPTAVPAAGMESASTPVITATGAGIPAQESVP